MAKASHLLSLLLAVIGSVQATETTRTEVRCQTFMGLVSPWAVATHTTTTLTDAPAITVGFTSKEISTITPDHLMTYNKTETSVSTITTTVTEKLTGSIFTTTSTQYIWKAKYVNMTTTIRTRSVTSEPFTVTMRVPTIEGFQPVNTTTEESTTANSTVPPITTTLSDGSITTILPPSAPASGDAGTITTIPDAGRTIYVMESGKLVPTPLSAVSALISEYPSVPSSVIALSSSLSTGASSASPSDNSASPTPSFVDDDPYRDMTDAELVKALLEAVSSNTLSSPSSAASSSIPVGSQSPSPAVTSAAEIASATSAGASADSSSPTPTSSPVVDYVEFENDDADDEPEEANTEKPHGTTLEASFTSTRSIVPIDYRTIPKPSTSSLPKRALTRVPKTYKGLRGALIDDPAITARPWPTEVSCTKSIIRETTIWAPHVDAPSFIALQPSTNTVTTISTLTLTVTVPDRTPFKTASFVSSTTMTTTTTFAHTTTDVEALIYTVSSTRTAYAACETQNLLGPLAANDSHIVNVFNRGAKAFAKFDIGHSSNAGDCCGECHTNTIPCLGSVFYDRRCYLFTDAKSRCTNQGAAAAFFVSRPSEERPPRRQRWPDYVVSNGPCGYFYDGGTGW